MTHGVAVGSLGTVVGMVQGARVCRPGLGQLGGFAPGLAQSHQARSLKDAQRGLACGRWNHGVKELVVIGRLVNPPDVARRHRFHTQHRVHPHPHPHPHPRARMLQHH